VIASQVQPSQKKRFSIHAIAITAQPRTPTVRVRRKRGAIFHPALSAQAASRNLNHKAHPITKTRDPPTPWWFKVLVDAPTCDGWIRSSRARTIHSMGKKTAEVAARLDPLPRADEFDVFDGLPNT
jgi:hypothetical protein